MRRKGSAIWTGSGKDGKGHLTTQSTVLNKTQYSAGSRFAEGIGTNPEELVAAAHAGCFSMKLGFVLTDAGFTADELATDCFITIDNGVITKSELILKAKIPGISKEKFDACAQDAKANCPISKLLNTAVSLDASLA
jgi:osmotically inducible protein OsmC